MKTYFVEYKVSQTVREKVKNVKKLVDSVLFEVQQKKVGLNVYFMKFKYDGMMFAANTKYIGKNKVLVELDTLDFNVPDVVITEKDAFQSFQIRKEELGIYMNY